MAENWTNDVLNEIQACLVIHTECAVYVCKYSMGVTSTEIFVLCYQYVECFCCVFYWAFKKDSSFGSFNWVASVC